MKPTLASIITTKSIPTDKNDWHSYCDWFYEAEFARYRHKPIQLVEIGVLSGGSMYLWAEYFSQAKILGVDYEIHTDIPSILPYPNINLLVGNAYSETTLNYVPPMDILIDDGPHTLDTQIYTLQNLLPKVRPGGICVIEDVQDVSWFEPLANAVPSHLAEFTQCIDLRHLKNRYDDLLFVVRVPE